MGSALLHEYGTGGVILQRGDRAKDHFSTRDGSLVLVLDLLIEDAHAALGQMLTASRGNDSLRRRVLSRSQRLLAPLKPVEVPGNPYGARHLDGCLGEPDGNVRADDGAVAPDTSRRSSPSRAWTAAFLPLTISAPDTYRFAPQLDDEAFGERSVVISDHPPELPLDLRDLDVACAIL